MNTPHERLTRTTFSLPLGEVHALVGGAVNARPLLFLHGFPDHPPTAVPFLEHLAETHRVVAPGILAMSEDSLLERVTAVAEERHLSQNTLSAYRRTWLKHIAWSAAEGLTLETLPSERAGGFYEEATRGRSASHHLQSRRPSRCSITSCVL